MPDIFENNKEDRFHRFDAKKYLSGRVEGYPAYTIARWLWDKFRAKPIIDSGYHGSPTFDLFRSYVDDDLRRRAALGLYYGLLTGGRGKARIYLDPSKQFASGYHLSKTISPHFGNVIGLGGSEPRPNVYSDIRSLLPATRRDFAYKLHPLTAKTPVIFYLPERNIEPYGEIPAGEHPKLTKILEKMTDFTSEDAPLNLSLYVNQYSFYPRDILDFQSMRDLLKVYRDILHDPEVYKQLGRAYAGSGLGFLNLTKPVKEFNAAFYYPGALPLGFNKPVAHIRNYYDYPNPKTLWHEYGHARSGPIRSPVLDEGYATFYAYYQLAKEIQKRNPELANKLVLQLTYQLALPLTDIVRIGNILGSDKPLRPEEKIAPDAKAILTDPNVRALMGMFALSPNARLAKHEYRSQLNKYFKLQKILEEKEKTTTDPEEKQLIQDALDRVNTAIINLVFNSK